MVKNPIDSAFARLRQKRPLTGSISVKMPAESAGPLLVPAAAEKCRAHSLKKENPA